MDITLNMGLDVFLTQNFTKPGEQEAVRCDTKKKLIEKGCPLGDIINPLSHSRNIENKPLKNATGDNKTPVQLQPQEIEVDLRPGMFS